MDQDRQRNVRSLDVAKKAGVSRTTVSYVLNGRLDVSIPEETRSRVLLAATELGYTPNMAARALVLGRTRLISFWTIGSTIRQQADVIQSIQSKLNRDHHECLISRFSVASGSVERTMSVADWPVDGVLAYNLNFSGSPEPVSIVPKVSMGCYFSPEGDYVGIDLKAGVIQAMHHLVSTGRRKIFYITAQSAALKGDSRYDGYSESMEHYGLNSGVIKAASATKRESLVAVREWLESRPDFDALMCYSDEMAIGAYRALSEYGYEVPGDVALVGCDGLDDLEYFEVPISTIVQPVDQMCQLAWDFLKARIAEPSMPSQQIVLQASLQIRESSDSLA